MNESWHSINLIGAKLTLLDWDGLIRTVAESVRSGRKILVASGNVFSFNLAYEKPWFRDFLNRANIVRLEGEGLRWGARVLGHRTPRRIVFADWIWDLADMAAREGFSFFLLGSRPGVADKAAARLRERFPNLRIAGTHHGYFDKTPGSAENEAVIQQINAARPNILFVGFGMPLQERWLADNWERLDVNVAFTCGALFDYVSGELRRAPKWMNDHGLEWLGRLIIEPRRLWRRYVIGNPLFLWRVLKQRLRQEMSGGRGPDEGGAA
ncbi:MAG: WecB/TagA/CpsF family glycosyltransferase [Chloroflexi bacterium]|nr:WecB/TagA/CpsF family glycosyltransferase [Chloroflexota bacterium]